MYGRLKKRLTLSLTLLFLDMVLCFCFQLFLNPFSLSICSYLNPFLTSPPPPHLPTHLRCSTMVGKAPYLSYLPSYVGQLFFLTPTCANSTGTLLHMLGSLVGLNPEHQRPDRDSYVDVLWDNIRPVQRDDYNVKPSIDTSYGPYDFGSIMHYSLNANSINGSNTLEPKVPYEGVIGQREGLSTLDVLKVNRMYGCATGELVWGPFVIMGGEAHYWE